MKKIVTLECMTFRFRTQKKYFGKHFVDYLGPTMFNSLSLDSKKNTFNNVSLKHGLQ